LKLEGNVCEQPKPTKPAKWNKIFFETITMWPFVGLVSTIIQILFSRKDLEALDLSGTSS